MKYRIDRYVAKHQFDEQKTTTLVKKLDMIEQKHQGSILALIATYAKYMIAYDAIYIDQVLK